MPRLSAKAIAIFAAASVAVGACHVFGPNEINISRPQYNNAIQKTYTQQVLANIVRVENHEQAFFMDVSEVDAGFTFQGTLSGGIGSIGANPHPSGRNVGTFTTGLEYQETPTIRYMPLLGASLATQLATPMTVDSIASMINTDWPTLNILYLAVDRITPGSNDYYSAVNALTELDGFQVLVFTAAKSNVTSAPVAQSSQSAGSDKSGGGGQGATAAAANDSLVVYLEPNKILTDNVRLDIHADTKDRSKDAQETVLKLWTRLLLLYRDTQAWGRDWPASRICEYEKAGAERAFADERYPRSIELRTVHIPADAPPVVSVHLAPQTPPAAEAGAPAKKVEKDPAAKPFTATSVSTKDGKATAVVIPVSSPADKQIASVTSVDISQTTYFRDAIPKDRAPILKTRSGQGMLLAAFIDPNYIDISDDRTRYEKATYFIAEPWNDYGNFFPDYYTFYPEDLLDKKTPTLEDDYRDQPLIYVEAVKRVRSKLMTRAIAYCFKKQKDQRICTDDRILRPWISEHPGRQWWLDKAKAEHLEGPIWTFYTADIDSKIDDEALEDEYVLQRLRRFMIIIKSTEEPSDDIAYVSYHDTTDGYWYYIDKKDQISRKNLWLISQILTIQAAPPSQPLTPTIGVGGGGGGASH
jgi:hypothetical protein